MPPISNTASANTQAKSSGGQPRSNAAPQRQSAPAQRNGSAAPGRNARAVANNAGAAANPRQNVQNRAAKPNLRRDPDIDGSKWSNKKSDSDVISMMTEKEEFDTSGFVNRGAQFGDDGEPDIMSELGLNDDDESFDQMLGEGGSEDGAEDDGLGLDGEDAGTETGSEGTDDAEDGAETGSDDDEDPFDRDLQADEIRSAARTLINAGWDRDEVKNLYTHAPQSLIAAARREAGNSQASGSGTNQAGNADQSFDQMLEQAMAESLAPLSKQFDEEGKSDIAKAVAAPAQAAVKFLGSIVAQRIGQLERVIHGIGSIVEASQIEAARAALSSEYPAIGDDKSFAKVRDRMAKLMQGGQYRNMQEAMADAAQRVLGKQSAAARRVNEARRSAQKDQGARDDGGVGTRPGPREITREQAQEIIHGLIERGMDPGKRNEYMKRFKIVKKADRRTRDE